MQILPTTSSEYSENIPAFSKHKHKRKRHQEIEELDAAIGQMSHTINAANYELMVLIREFDERGGWLKWGFTDGLNWLKWRCDLSTNAARDKLRIAHALKELPLLSAYFSEGKLSYTKVRALTRVATAANESDLIDMAMRMSARHVEEPVSYTHLTLPTIYSV